MDSRTFIFGFEVYNNLLKRDPHVRCIHIKGLKTGTDYGQKLLSIQDLDNKNTGLPQPGYFYKFPVSFNKILSFV